MKTAEERLDIDDLVSYVKSETGFDLTKYRPTTLNRRISHRQFALGLGDLHDYILYLYANPSELKNITDSTTIHVTEFFRDLDVFDYFPSKLLPAVVERKKGRYADDIRVWSAGCSTGQEAYSISILLDKFLKNYKIEAEVIGTDISQKACNSAKRAIYSEKEVECLPENIIRKYFRKSEDGYTVIERIREKTSFFAHDLFSSPRFSGFDIVVCRNVLIHFKRDYRGEVIDSFYSVLNDSGLLILGKSEALSKVWKDKFKLLNPSMKVYQKIT